MLNKSAAVQLGKSGANRGMGSKKRERFGRIKWNAKLMGRTKKEENWGFFTMANSTTMATLVFFFLLIQFLSDYIE